MIASPSRWSPGLQYTELNPNKSQFLPESRETQTHTHNTHNTETDRHAAVQAYLAKAFPWKLATFSAMSWLVKKAGISTVLSAVFH